MNENPLDTQPDPPGQDPWDRIHDCDRDEKFVQLPSTPQSHEPPSFTVGEIIAYLVLGLGVVGGIIILVVIILNEMLRLP